MPRVSRQAPSYNVGWLCPGCQKLTPRCAAETGRSQRQAGATLQSGLAKYLLLGPIQFMTVRVLSLFACLTVILATAAHSGRATIAVATNFLTTAQDVSMAFTAETGHEVVLVHGSTGKLFAQILAGAPYDVFLSADADRPARLAEGELLAEGSPKPYAIGRLALVHRDGDFAGSIEAILAREDLRIAMADPTVAPYGNAALEVIRSVHGSDWTGDIVLGESVAQAFAFVATGNADVGLVALSLALSHSERVLFLEVPDTLHNAIRQDAALLGHPKISAAAHAFFGFLDHPIAAEIIKAAGYGVPR